MRISDLIGYLLVATAGVLLVLCGWGAHFGHVGALRMAWWATASGFVGLGLLLVPPTTPRV